MSEDLTLESLELVAIGSARGRRAEPLELEVVRELNAGDRELILNPPPQGAHSNAVVRLRTPHHAIARLLAEGRKAIEVSEITGYSASRISILQNDPAFKELLSYYREQKEQHYFDVHARLAALGMTCVEELQERLEENPEMFSAKELRELAEMVLDRSLTAESKPKSSAPVAINIQFVSPEAGPGGGPTLELTAETVR